MKTVELYLHGLKWKNQEVSEDLFKIGIVSMCTLLHDSDTSVREERAAFRIRECANMIAEPILHPNLKSPNGRGFDISDIPIDRIDVRDSNFTGMKETLYIWYRANCDDPSFFVDEQGELAFREIEKVYRPENVKRFFPDVEKKSTTQSKAVPQNNLTVFDIIDLE